MIHALVTGHSRGLGAAIALELQRRGAKVLGLSRRGGPAGVAGARVDLADAPALAAWLDGGELQRFVAGASVAVLVNNAGTVQPVAPAGRQGAGRIASAVALNLGAALILSDALIAASAAVPERRIVHVSSGAARKPYAGWSVYCATKAALDMHAQAVALDAPPGLRIESLAPGVIDTAMQAELRASTPDDFPQHERFVGLHREGALVAPDDAARRLVDHLLSPAFGRQAATDLRELSA